MNNSVLEGQVFDSRVQCTRDIDNIILRLLLENPALIQWKKPEKIQLQRNSKNELGVMLNTFKERKRRDTYTVITKVKDSCCAKNEGILDVGYRILKINGDKIKYWTLNQVEDLLIKLKKSKKSKPQVSLNLCQPLIEETRQYCEQSCVTVTRSLPISPSRISSHINQPRSHSLKESGTMPVARRSGLEFSSLDSCSEEIAKRALSRPWDISWAKDVLTVYIKKQNGKLGVTYKFKKHEKTTDVYCIVEKAQGPSQGKLHVGDVVHSVNHIAVVAENTFVDEISKCKEDSVKICFQRPQGLLNNAEMLSIGSLGSSGGDTNGIHAPTESLRFHTIGNEIDDRDITINVVNERETEFNGPVEHGQINERQIRSNVSSNQFSNGYTDNTINGDSTKGVATLSKGTNHTKSSKSCPRSLTPDFSKRGLHLGHKENVVLGHRRNLSDSSSVQYRERIMGNDKLTSFREREAQLPSQSLDLRLKTEQLNTKTIAKITEQSLSDFGRSSFGTFLYYFPYVRLLQLDTRDHQRFDIFQYVEGIFCGQKGLFTGCTDQHFSFKKNLNLTNTAMLPLPPSWKPFSIEEIIYARQGALHLKEDKDVLANLKSCQQTLSKSPEKSVELIGRFLKDPPGADARFIELEANVLSLTQVCRPENSVLLTKNSVVIITVDLDKCVDSERLLQEMQRVSVCINNVRASCEKPYVLFVANSSRCSPDTEQDVAQHLEEFRNCKYVNGHCKPCVVVNDITGFSLFNIAIENHASILRKAILQGVRDVAIGEDKRFPLLGLMLQQELRDCTSPIIAETNVSDVIKKLCPSLECMKGVLKRTLNSLHDAGKLVSPGSMLHLSSSEKLLEMFILRQPSVLISCMAKLRANCERGVVNKRHLTGHLEDLVMLYYLQLFNCLLRIDHEQYIFLPDHLMTLQPTPESTVQNPVLYRLDFDGFLPSSAINYLFCKMASALETDMQLRGNCRLARYCLKGSQTRMELYLDPYGSKGRIYVELKAAHIAIAKLREITPAWLTFYSEVDHQQNKFHILNWPVGQLPDGLKCQINQSLRDHSPLGNDVRKFAEILLDETKSNDLCASGRAGLVVLQELEQKHPEATLNTVIAALKEMRRQDILRDIDEWIRTNHK